MVPKRALFDCPNLSHRRLRLQILMVCLERDPIQSQFFKPITKLEQLCLSIQRPTVITR